MMLQSQLPADILLKNGVIFTADERQPWAEWAAVSGNRFLAVGKNADILPLAGEHTKTFDLQGRTVIPGFNNAHTHYIGAAIEEACTFSMFGVITQAEAGDIITRFATQNPDLEWLHGNRLDLGRFENG